MRSVQTRRKAVGLFLALCILAVALSPPFLRLYGFPEHLSLSRDEPLELEFRLPLPVTVRSEQQGMLSLNGHDVGAGAQQLRPGARAQFEPLRLGQVSLDLRLLGLIPFRRLVVEVVPPLHLVPGGHSIGVIMQNRGVLVVGYAGVPDAGGAMHLPARDAGVEPGDTILSIDGQAVESEQHAAELIAAAGRAGTAVALLLQRGERRLSRQVQPVRDAATDRWRIGLKIRGGTAGVGTLTFYDPVTRRFGALGHVIADAQTGRTIDLRAGHIVSASVTAIEKGAPGAPGEKIGVFVREQNRLGLIDRNTRFGIFGQLEVLPEPIAGPQTLPVGLAAQVQEGPAELVTVVDGTRLERYAIEITRVMRQPQADGKSLVLKITDPRLLSKTRGIVQGMSGSPIIQNGRLVGAVTHVFVNDPSRGYGVLIEQMLQESGLLGLQRHRTGPAGTAPRAGALPRAGGGMSSRNASKKGRKWGNHQERACTEVKKLF